MGWDPEHIRRATEVACDPGAIFGLYSTMKDETILLLRKPPR